MSEHDFEPVRGLPKALPEGERILWQGAPDWWALAQRAFHCGSLSIYFVVLIAWRAVATGSIEAGLQMAPLAVACLGLLAGLAALMARTTVYTITNKRIVMRFGLALPKAINIPFAIVASADVRSYGDKTGDVSLTLSRPHAINYFLLWPHARPWKWMPAQPTLRAIPRGADVAEILSTALRGAHGAGAAHVVRDGAESAEPVLSPA